jgi:hypothetical protein
MTSTKTTLSLILLTIWGSDHQQTYQPYREDLDSDRAKIEVQQHHCLKGLKHQSE